MKLADSHITDKLYSKPCKFLQILLIFYWMNFLLASDSYYSVYLICGIMGIFSVYNNKPGTFSSWKMIFSGVMSVFFSASVMLANWKLFSDLSINSTTIFQKAVLAATYLFVFIAGFSICHNTILYLSERFQNFSWTPVKRTKKQIIIFAVVCMAIICVIDILVLFLCNYPAAIPTDGVSQLKQLTYNTYKNHHPFWHTMIIKVWITIGMHIFHEVNAAVALYSVFQIIALAACFTYALTTLYEAGIPMWANVMCFLYFAIVPYNIIYSFTIWKDTLFGGMVLVFVVAMYRVINEVGNQKLNYVILFFGGLGMSLLRSNGYIAFVLSVFVFIVLFRKQYIKVIGLFLGIILVAFIMKHPVLKALDVAQPDFVESLSIPLQQVARVITDGNELTPEQSELFGEIIDLSTVPDTYLDYLSDPIKNSIRGFGNQDYLVEHKAEFFKAWLEIGLKYPGEYVRAWVDQTKGYWHGGYQFWIWVLSVSDNPLGIHDTVNSLKAVELRDEYLNVFKNTPALTPLRSIGFHFWVLMVVFCCNVINKRRTEIFLTVPNIAITLSLLIATPVFSEFRYDYGLFTCLVFTVLCSVYLKHSKESTAELNTGNKGA